MSTAARPRSATRLLYGTYAWLTLLLCALPVVGLLSVTPGLRHRRRITRRGARLFLRLIGSRVDVEGAPPSGDSACVVAANHASYLDGIILKAVLPPRFTFLIKHEMAYFPLAGFILRRIGSEFVDRADPTQRNRIVRRLVRAAREGDALALFPEGTFRASPGLRPFQAGAFAAAWQAGVPVVPAVIRGSRAKLPSGAFLASPGSLTVRLCEPLPSRQFASARELMQATRRAILEHLGEPDLADGATEDAAAPAAEPTLGA